jgi:hypothetical protein
MHPAKCENISLQRYLWFNGQFEIRARQRPLIYSGGKASKDLLPALDVQDQVERKRGYNASSKTE